MNTLTARRLFGLMPQAPGCVAPMLFSTVGVAHRAAPTAGWNGLLQHHVKVIDDGHTSPVDYASTRRDDTQLETYTHPLSAITATQFHAWNRNQQKAFLINAYPAFTVQRLLTRWPTRDSIKNIGGASSSPWKIHSLTLLGQHSSLDPIEPRLRNTDYADPRIHFALNSTSISCPALRAQGYVAERLDHQLDDATTQCLADRSRHRYDPRGDILPISKIFDGYAVDFKRSSYRSAAGWLALHDESFSDDRKVVARTRAQRVDSHYVPYAWHLNKWIVP